MNADEAAKSYLRAAVSGFVRAKFNLGILYLRGAGVERSADRALDWRGGRCGMFEAATSYLYANRLGVPRDERKARELIRKAPKTNDLIVYAN